MVARVNIIISQPADVAVDVYFHNVISLRLSEGWISLFFGASGRQEGGAGNASGGEERERSAGRSGDRKCVEGVLLVIGANLILPFARRSPY